MVKVALQIKAVFEHIASLKTSHPNYSFQLKIKCLNCGEVSDKWHDVTESETFPSKHTKSESNYLAKCKLCSRENSLDIVQGSNGVYTNDDQGSFKTLVVFDCRGIEPVEFKPQDGWIAEIEESKKVFEVDLSENEWVDYDDKIKESVGVYEFESRFVKVK